MTDPVARTRHTYDAIANAYEARTQAVWPRLTELVAAFTAMLPSGAAVLDAGCGPGRDSALLRERGARTIGLDLSAAMLRAGRPGTIGTVALADMRALPVRGGSVDGVWCQAALLHVPRDDVPRVLAGFARVTRPGGALHLGVAEGDGEHWEHESYGSPGPRWFVHHRAAPLVDRLAHAGWQVRNLSRATTHRRWLYLLATRA